MSEKNVSLPDLNRLRLSLQAECKNCFGLCCAALYFSASEGFPQDKKPGQPCFNLQPDFRCQVHQHLKEHGFKGCLAFDCCGAGQKVAQVSFGGFNWREKPESAEQMFEIFLIMRQLHELLWYLTEALMLPASAPIHQELKSMLEEIDRLTHLSPASLLKLDLAGQQAAVNVLLKQTCDLLQTRANPRKKVGSRRSKYLGPCADLIGADLTKRDLRGADLAGAYLIAANLSGLDLGGTIFIGADLRDADLSGADLSQSIFLTQFQVNTALGDDSTKLPVSIIRPAHWVQHKLPPNT
ncbi:MAG: pentapeptide repeat-containing protein [Methylocystaceae bacterium]